MFANLQINEVLSEKEKGVYYVVKTNPKSSWPSNSTLAEFVSNGVYKKFKVLTIGSKDTKVVMIK